MCQDGKYVGEQQEQYRQGLFKISKLIVFDGFDFDFDRIRNKVLLERW